MQESEPTTGHGCSGVYKATNMAGVAGEKTGTQFMGDSRKITSTIRLQDVYSPEPSQAPIRIRPPAPRPPPTQEAAGKPGVSSDPPTKPIMRRRARSLPSCSEQRKELRRAQVRFVDALGLDLEEVKVFRVQERPSVPQHVMFRLLMSSEMAFGNLPELSLPYFKPCFPENMSARPDFRERLRAQRVSLEQVACSEQGIAGTVQVLNLAYHKRLTVHYSFTNWRTRMDKAASWVSSGHWGGPDDPGTDVFRFHLPVPPFILQPGAMLEFAICYQVNGADYWDNNNGNNYKLSCYSYTVTVPKECEGSMLHFI